MCIVDSTASQSIQESLYPWLTCFVCGPANLEGLQLHSYEDGETAIGEFTPWPAHDNGLGFLNGGIIAAVLDCHTGAAVFSEARRRDWRAIGDAPLPYVTAGIDVKYLRPTPLHATLELWAAVAESSESEMAAVGELRANGKVCASARTMWKRWRPRPAAAGGVNGA